MPPIFLRIRNVMAINITVISYLHMGITAFTNKSNAKNLLVKILTN